MSLLTAAIQGLLKKVPALKTSAEHEHSLENILTAIEAERDELGRLKERAKQLVFSGDDEAIESNRAATARRELAIETLVAAATEVRSRIAALAAQEKRAAEDVAFTPIKALAAEARRLEREILAECNSVADKCLRHTSLSRRIYALSSEARSAGRPELADPNFAGRSLFEDFKIDGFHPRTSLEGGDGVLRFVGPPGARWSGA